MTSAYKFFSPNVPIIIEVSGITASIAAGAVTEDFILNAIAFPLIIASVKVYSVTAAISPYTFEIYENLARTAQNLAYRVTGINRLWYDTNPGISNGMYYRPAKQNLDMAYGDNIATQATNAFFCRITNNDAAAAASTFYVEIRYGVQGGQMENDLSATIPTVALVDNT